MRDRRGHYAAALLWALGCGESGAPRDPSPPSPAPKSAEPAQSPASEAVEDHGARPTVAQLEALLPAAIDGLPRSADAPVLLPTVPSVAAAYGAPPGAVSLSIAVVEPIGAPPTRHAPYMGKPGTVRVGEVEFRGLFIDGFPAQRQSYTTDDERSASDTCVNIHRFFEVCLSVSEGAQADDSVRLMKAVDLDAIAAAAVGLGAVAQPREPEPPAPPPPEVVSNEDLEARCRAQSDAVACNALAFRYEKGAGIEADATKATALYERGCTLGRAIACTNFAGRLYNGAGTERDFKRAAALYKDACELGKVPAACHALGIMHRDGSGMEPDAPGAVTYFGRACDDHYGIACSELGLAYLRGRGVPPDEAKAKTLFAKACDAGYLQACPSATR